MRTRARSSSWSICPSIRGDCRSSVCSFTTLAPGSTTPPRCWAEAGALKAMKMQTASAPTANRARANIAIIARAPVASRRPPSRLGGSPGGSHRDSLAISSPPAPGAGAVAALDHAFLVDLGDDLAVACEQRLGRAHLRAQRQLALRHAIGAVLLVFLNAAGRFRATAAGAIGALVHLAARTEVADARILRRAERAGVEAVAAADAQILRMEDDAVIGRENARHRADRGAGSVGAVHAGHGDRTLAGLAVVDSDDAPAVDAPRHLVLVLAGGDAGVALDAAVGVAEEFHSRHIASPTLPGSDRGWPSAPACPSPGRTRRWSACSRSRRARSDRRLSDIC